MKTTQIVLPTHQWNNYKTIIKKIGEGEVLSEEKLINEYKFLYDLGIICTNKTNQLTSIGNSLFEAIYIRCDSIEEEKITQKLILEFPPTQAVQQYLWGLSDIKIDQVLTVLKKTGFWVFEENKLLTNFLDLLNLVKIIRYDRKNKKIIILISPDKTLIPQSIYIDPMKPYGNIYWVKKMLEECKEYIYWIDKNFTNEAFDWLYAIADGSKISEIRILSLDMGDNNLSKKSKKNYKRFKEELVNRNIKVVWRTIESTKIKDTHDRWIISGNDFVRNVPNVNSISSGKRSEMIKSYNHKEILPVFLEYWGIGIDVVI